MTGSGESSRNRYHFDIFDKVWFYSEGVKVLR
jgi:hypothetical protein